METTIAFVRDQTNGDLLLAMRATHTITLLKSSLITGVITQAIKSTLGVDTDSSANLNKRWA